MVSRVIEWFTSYTGQLFALTTTFFLINATLYYTVWDETIVLNQRTESTAEQALGNSKSGVTQGWVAGYVASHTINDSDFEEGGNIDTWATEKISTMLQDAEQGRPTSTTIVQQRNTSPIFSFGDGINLSGLTITSALGSAIDAGEILAGAVTFDKISAEGCTNNQVLKFNGIAWGCRPDDIANLSASSGATNRVALFTSPSVLGSSYLIQDDDGLIVDGDKNLYVGGVITGDGSGLTNIDGSQIKPNSITNSAFAPGSISNDTLANSSVGSSNIQDGAVTLSKLGQSGCSAGQIAKWNGLIWSCAADENTNTQYVAGAGLNLDTTTNSFYIDSSSSNTWSGLQIFGGGFNIGGRTYLDLVGTGLSFSGGTLRTTLGTVIDGTELVNGAVSNDKLADQAVSFAKLADAGCDVNQVIKWNGSEWACGIDVDNDTVYTAGQGLQLQSTVFSLDTSNANQWTGTQSFGGGLVLSGNTYTNLAGSGLVFSGGNLSTSLGSSIEASELADGAVTNDKIADGTINVTKLSQNGCTLNQMLAWSGTSWACIDPENSSSGPIPPTYSAGDGLVLNGTIFSLDELRANNWDAVQNFDGGITVNGNTYTNFAGTGLTFSGGTLNSTLGTMIDSIEISDNAINGSKIADGTVATADLANDSVTFAKLSQNGCVDGNVPTWSSANSAWVCLTPIDTDTDTNTTYNAGNGLSLNNGTHTFSLNLAQAHNWLAVQTFGAGVSIGGSTYTNLAGSGLTFDAGVLNATLGNSIETAELADGAVTNDKIASGSISLNKLSQNGCTVQQILKWSGTAWVCGNDIDTNTTYTAGNGLSLTSGAFALDVSHANTWSGLQSFGAGLVVNGSTFTNLVGTGLSLSSGTLSSSIGAMVDTAEVTDGAITTAKILDGTVITADLADNAVTSAKILDGTIAGVDIASGTITANNISDGTITLSKLSSNARKRLVTANIPTILVSVLSTQEQPIFVAPTNGTITKVTFTSSNNILSASNQGTISVERKTSSAATVASIPLSSISLTALTPANATVGGGTSFNTGDIYTFKYAPGLAGLTLSNMLVTIEYTAND